MRSILVFCLLLLLTVSARAASSFTVNGNSAVNPTNLALPGWLSVTNPITNNTLTASKIVLSGTGKQLISSAFGESDLASFATTTSLSNKIDTLNGLGTNTHIYGFTNTGGFQFQLTDSGVLADSVLWYDSGDVYLNRDLFYLPAVAGVHTVAKFGAGKQLESIANGTGALTNDGANGIGYYARFLSATNDTITWGVSPTRVLIKPDGANGMVINNEGIGNLIDFTAAGAINFPNGTASSILYLDSSKNLSIVFNGAGALTNNGAGGVGFYDGYIAIQSGNGNNNTLTNLTVETLLSNHGRTTNTLAVNNAAAVTNWSTLRQKGAVVIESTLDFGTAPGNGRLNTDGSIVTAGLGSFNGITNQVGLNGRLVVYGSGGVLNSATSTDADIISKITLLQASNAYTFNGSQFAPAEANGTNVSIKNGVLLTNASLYSSTTTTVPELVALAGGHNTNALEIRQGPAVVGGFDSNGIATMTISNASTVYPAIYRTFTQLRTSTCTNISTTETTWLGSGVGSLTFPANFWQEGRSVMIDAHGDSFTGAAPGNTSIRIKIGTTVIATNWPMSAIANMVADIWSLRATITCWTNSASVGYLECEGEWRQLSTTGGQITHTKQFKATTTVLDTTASSALDIVSTNGATTSSYRTKTCIVTVVP